MCRAPMVPMIYVTPEISLQESELQEEFVRASGPGGQNVNKVSTAVQLRFDVANSPSLSPEVRERLVRLAGHRMTSEGVLLIKAQRYRTQERNRQDAAGQLVELIRRAAQKPVARRKTKPTKASQVRRLESKKRHSETKRLRRTTPLD
jgi:ribosome-associated protein